jgi:hypothetical protein
MPRLAHFQLARNRHSTPIGRAAHKVEPQVIRRVGENLGVAVTAQQHRHVAVPAQIERKQDVLVPEDVDLLPAIRKIGSTAPV